MQAAQIPNVERALVYRTLASLFRSPSEDVVADLRRRQLPELHDALAELGEPEELLRAVDRLAKRIAEVDPRSLESSYERTFEPSGGPQCPPHETAYGSPEGNRGMLRTFDLADIAGFYRAFGVEVCPGTERVDHIAAELEFMHLLAVKEAIAEREGSPEQVEVCRDAARTFLSDHLTRWSGGLAAQLEARAADSLYATAGRLLAGFVATDAARLGSSAPLSGVVPAQAASGPESGCPVDC